MSTSSVAPITLTFPTPVLPRNWKLDDLQAHLGGIPLSRIRLFPPPGMATADDAFALRREEGVLCELIDGVLVEKTMGWLESSIAGYLIFLLHNYLQGNPLGVVLAPDGFVRVFPKEQIRAPDVSFIRFDRLTPAAYKQKVCPVTPDLAVEILSAGNTAAEIDRKLIEYFGGGIQLAWIIDPEQRRAAIYTSPDKFTSIDENGTLDGGEVLPGFSVLLSELLRKPGE